MSEWIGKIVVCDRCGRECRRKLLSGEDLDGGFTHRLRFAEMPPTWKYQNDVGWMCPDCSAEYESLISASRKKERVMQIEVNNDNVMQVRRFYLSLCDQGRANFLWDNQISGGKLKLSPAEYPKAAPMHRVCRCGADPELELGSDHSRVMCPRCGCRTASCRMPLLAWRAWDAEDIEVDDQNITIWEVM